MLKVKNASKTYGKHQVLQGISLEVEKNKIIGLAGPSGSGKSTLLRCIQKLDNLDKGEIICDEEIGFMFQDFQLFPHMTVLQNLVYAPLLCKMNDVENNALSLLVQLGIRNKAYSYPSQLSGGQKQRTALARSLMMHPTLLLCDEPTSGLDIATIENVIALLKLVKNKMQITMIIASHDLDFLIKISDKIVLLKNGKIATDVEPKNEQNLIKILYKYY